MRLLLASCGLGLGLTTPCGPHSYMPNTVVLRQQTSRGPLLTLVKHGNGCNLLKCYGTAMVVALIGAGNPSLCQLLGILSEVLPHRFLFFPVFGIPELLLRSLFLCGKSFTEDFR